MLRRYSKGIAIVLLMTFGQELILPGALWALTGGPSQPEVNSFEPVGTNQMVDLSTGDFNYNIPLMVVPGPNGGYPINLAYHAGIGMEQEASWVGLGWNINPGAITRNLRGVPDDFSGDEIVKRTNMKADITAGLSVHMDQFSNSALEKEKHGYKPAEAVHKSASLKVYYNNYRGVGYSAVLSHSHLLHKQVTAGLKYDRFFKLGAALSFDSNSGLGIDLDPSLARDYNFLENNWKLNGFSAGIGLNTRQGLSSLRFAHSGGKDILKSSLTTSSSISFANQTYVPGSNYNMLGFNVLVGLVISKKHDLPHLKKTNMIRGEFTSNSLVDKELNYSAFGSIYLENENISDEGEKYNSMMDANVYNDIPINKRSVYMGFPLLTADLYSISGQGVGGTFRAHRNDISSLYESGNVSNTFQGSTSNEIGFQFEAINPLDPPVPAPPLGYTFQSNATAGQDYNAGYHRSYSGRWNSNYIEKLSTIEKIKIATVGLGIDAEIDVLINEVSKLSNMEDIENLILIIAGLPTTDIVKGKLFDYLIILSEGTDAIGLKFKGKSSRTPTKENFYFKTAGEKTATELNEWDYMLNEKPIAFDMVMDWTGKSPKPFTKGNIIGTGSGGRLKERKNQERIKRVQNIEYRKKGEIIGSENYHNRPHHLFYEGESPLFPAGASIDYHSIDGAEANVDHHIQEYSILRPDGSRYTYGLPAYNTHQEENVFANRSGAVADGIINYEDSDLVTYDASDASIVNDEGVDHYFSGTEIPPYAHANMLTEITSADYVDLTGDGVSEDDFGFYAKFNYTEVADYKWRDPFYGADYIKGYYSNELDDKATFAYGSKNLFYTHSIETKTHVAVFEMGEREDGIGANNDISDDWGRNRAEGDPLVGKKQKYLKSIKLYSKRDLEAIGTEAIPLQTVDFKYSYELCQGVYNNQNIADDAIDVPEDFILDEGGETLPIYGKLTLKQVSISYNGNDKGRLSPYEFDYGFNPDYSRLDIDRWGNYQDVEGPNPYENVVNPYTRQNEGEVNGHAAAWNLSQVNLPSGGKISVDYESDSYGYVQDHRAGQMVEVLGFTEVSDDTWSGGEASLKMKKKNLRLWFKADNLDGVAEPNRDQVVHDYIDGLQEIYFKIFSNLKQPYDLSDVMAEDYVVGYAQIEPDALYGADGGGGDFGYVDLIVAEYTSAALFTFETHPFQKAGMQYLRYSRSDLFNDQGTYDDFADGVGGALLSIPLTLASLLKSSLATISLGEYNQYRILGYCKTMSTKKKSFIRLNSPDKCKYGGGHRVSAVSLDDNWAEGSRTFGTVYEYQNADGKTSGVADYEPIVGGEENALKKPLRFNGNGQLINFHSNDIYIEEPISEAVYPGARVVYGRVVVKNQDDSEDNIKVDETQSGISVNEFYTAKDFPVETFVGELEKTKGGTFPMYIPFLGFSSVNNIGYSQGYTVITNDMSGQPKSVASYPYRDGIIEGLPISEVKYHYKTDNKGRLDNEVMVLDAHGEKRKAVIGVEQDLTIFEEENSGYTESLGFEAGVSAGFYLGPPGSPLLPYVIPFPQPYHKLTADHAESMYRGISTSKIIRKSGILDEVEVFSDGSTVITKNLLYDAETGEALLTTVNNEWDKPVYNYNYAAHWNYDGMGGAYKNYRANVYFAETAGLFTLYAGDGGEPIPASTILIPGDEITVNEAGTYRTYYVSSITGVNFDLQDKSGDSFSYADGIMGTITRSGRRNLQAAKSGSIVSLSQDFLNASGDFSPLFLAWNINVTGSDPQEGEGHLLDLVPYINLNTNLSDVYDWRADEIFIPNAYNCQTGNYINAYVSISSSDFLEEQQIHFYSADGVDHLGDLDFPDDLYNPFIDEIILPVDVGGGITSYTEQLTEFEIVAETFDDGGNTLTVTLKHLPSGKEYPANYVSNPNYLKKCQVSDILHSDAIVYSDDWKESYPYADFDDLEVYLGTNISNADINDYRYGKKGVWRAKKTYLYQIPRKQSGVEPTETRANIDGEYEPWEPYSWLEGAMNPKWDWVSEITRYSPYGYGLEEKSRLNKGADDDVVIDEVSIYSSQMYGYDNSVVIAAAALASYFEFGYTGFEQGSIGDDLNNTGHINLLGTHDVFGEKAHTGTNSLVLLNTESTSFTMADFVESEQNLKGVDGKKYVVSVWVNVEETGAIGTLTIGSSSVTTADSREIIDGWKKLELSFVMGGADVDITYSSTGKTYIDDLRVGPYDGGMVTYVYDRRNLWLVAELDGLNYATFYNYDEEGNLVQVKKETEEGIVTVQTARSNTLQQ